MTRKKITVPDGLNLPEPLTKDKTFEEWRAEKLLPFRKKLRQARDRFDVADRRLDRTFGAFDVDKRNADKERAWIVALGKWNMEKRAVEAAELDLSRAEELYNQRQYNKESWG